MTGKKGRSEKANLHVLIPSGEDDCIGREEGLIIENDSVFFDRSWPEISAPGSPLRNEDNERDTPMLRPCLILIFPSAIRDEAPTSMSVVNSKIRSQISLTGMMGKSHTISPSALQILEHS
jgi:hypothetical protein